MVAYWVCGEKNQRVDEDAGPDCGCELRQVSGMVLPGSSKTYDPDASLRKNGGTYYMLSVQSQFSSESSASVPMTGLNCMPLPSCCEASPALPSKGSSSPRPC